MLLQADPAPAARSFRCSADSMRLRLSAGLLGQDEDLHDEYAAEYEAGAGDVVLERRERRGSVLLRKGEKPVNYETK